MYVGLVAFLRDLGRLLAGSCGLLEGSWAPSWGVLGAFLGGLGGMFWVS